MPVDDSIATPKEDLIPGTNKSRKTTLLLCIFLGWIGIHRFYVGKVGSGIFYFITMGGFGLGWFWDIYRIAAGKFRTDGFSDVEAKSLQSLTPYGFRLTQKVNVGACSIGIDETNRLWVLLSQKFPKIHQFSDIVDVEILEDNKTVLKSSNVVGRSLVGGALFGGVGAIIGGTTSDQEVRQKRTKLGVRVVLKDLNSPMVYIDCMYSQQQVDQVYSLFTAMMKTE